MKTYDRVLRHDVFDSDRFVELPSDTDRLCWIAMLGIADDFGNFEGSGRRLWRWANGFAQVKTEADIACILSRLCDADLLRRYTVGDKAFFHIQIKCCEEK